MKKTLLLLSLFLFTMPSFAEVNSIAVIASGNKNFNSTYTKNASQLASLLANKKKSIFCSGVGTGLSGAFLKTLDNKKGEFTAVIYQDIDETICPTNNPCQHLKIQKVPSLERQMDLFIRNSEALVLLPGGFDVMYAFNYFESLVQDKKQPYKPVVFLNINHFWDRTYEMLIEMRRQNIISKEIMETIAFESKPNNVLKTINKLQKNIENILKKEK
ncbi:MAG: LOG family protein [Alphaproteobacteria bacterium]|nr:LOG family protein [Alphaproteobacteria bacterium]